MSVNATAEITDTTPEDKMALLSAAEAMMDASKPFG
jgi:hypothetical protein